MKTQLLFMAVSSLLLMSYSDNPRNSNNSTNSSYSPNSPQNRNNLNRPTSYEDSSKNQDYNADNTGKNVRDRNGNLPTADNQSENAQDLKLSQSLRQALTEDNTLSTNAKNIKVITINGVMSLRGPVDSDAERMRIGDKAASIDGVKQVNNLLEVVKK